MQMSFKVKMVPLFFRFLLALKIDKQITSGTGRSSVTYMLFHTCKIKSLGLGDPVFGDVITLDAMPCLTLQAQTIALHALFEFLF